MDFLNGSAKWCSAGLCFKQCFLYRFSIPIDFLHVSQHLSKNFADEILLVDAPHKFCHINACLDLLIIWFGNPHIKPALIWWTDLFCVGSCINQWRWSHQSSHHCRVNLKIKKMKTMFILRFYHLFPDKHK